MQYEEGQHIERLWPLSKASLVCGMSVFGIRKALRRNGVRFVCEGTTRDGGRKYAESDLRRVLGERFSPGDECSDKGGNMTCLICGGHIQDGEKTHGLCLDCWCRELNKNLIGKGLPMDEAVAETIRSLHLP